MIACFKSVLRAVLAPCLLLSTISVACLMSWPSSAVAAVPNDPFDIVYVRVKRSTTHLWIPENAGNTYRVYTYDGDDDRYGTPVDKPIFGDLDQAFFDTLPEVFFIKGGFNAPGQLVWRHKDGSETIIYDCFDNGQLPQDGDPTCVPMDPAVSYDGKKVIFSVYRGTYKVGNRAGQTNEVGKLRYGTQSGGAQIYIYDFDSRSLTAWPHQEHDWDTAPVWLPDGKVMFSTTRAHTWQTYVLGSTDLAQQLWIADADGGNAHTVDPHDQHNALHPFVHSAGRVFYSSHQINKVRTEGFHQTDDNLWWLMSTDLRGGDLNAHLHAHYFKWGDITLTALHFLGELQNGDMCSDMYYRHNNFGAGRIICWPALAAHENPADEHSPLGHEGPYPFKHPAGYYSAVVGDSGDSGAKTFKDQNNHYIYEADGFPKLEGRVHARDPAGLPHGQLLFAAGIGEASNCHSTKTNRLLLYTRRGLSCDMGIYQSNGLPVDAPHGYKIDGEANDAVVVVNRPEWHEFMPKPVMPYSNIYGMDKPTAQTPPSNTGDSDTSYGIFASTNAFIGDLEAYPLISTDPDGTVDSNSNWDYWEGPDSAAWCAQQGCAMQALVRQPNGYQFGDLTGEIKAVRFWKALPNTRQYDNQAHKLYNIWGQKLELLGDVPVEDDGSFMAKLPADTPFLMAGVDKDGRAIARHQQLMSMRPGEKQVCAGCHLHSTTDGENAQNAFEDTLAASLPPMSPQLGAGEMGVLEWKAEIYTMLKENCGSCHNGTQGSNKPNLVGIAGYPSNTDPAENVYRILLNNMYPRGDLTDGDEQGKYRKTSRVPWMTRYVNVFFSRESLLYWKAAGERTDGRTDASRSDDFNFGPAHPAHLNATELTRLADWIEAGAYMDQHADVDIIFQDGFGP